MDFKKGDWVNTHTIVLTPAERAPQVPEDTKKVPLELWVKGFAQTDGNIGDVVKVTTVTGRVAEGEVVTVNPTYTHSYGDYVPELHKIGFQLREILFGGDDNE